MDRCLLEQCHKRVNVFKRELLDVSRSIATIEDAKELPDEKSRISDAIFSADLKISELLSSVLPHLMDTSYSGDRFGNNLSCMYTTEPNYLMQ